MKRIIFHLVCLLLISSSLTAQSYFTRDGKISFLSKSPVEDIHAENNQVLSIIDLGHKQLAFNLLIKGFLFQKQLMQDHFNEDVMESDKFPKANFTGKIMDNTTITAPGTYQVTISGNLTIRGISKPLMTHAILVLDGSKLHATASFNVATADYEIKIPAILKNNIGKTIAVKVDVDCNPK